MKKVFTFTLGIFLFLSAGMPAHAEGLKDIFSAKYYADKYPDLYAAFEYDEDKLFNHYLEYGMKEGRGMSPIIDIERYRGKYADLEEAFGDKWDLYANHWYEYGINEKRDDGTRFNPQLYVESYPDLKAAFGTDYVKGAKHYLEYGIYEGRILGFEPEPQTTTWSAPLPEETMPSEPNDQEEPEEENVLNGIIPTYTNGILTKETKYENGIIISETNYDASGAFLETIVYGYDAASGRIATKEYVDEDGSRIQLETYDELDRMVSRQYGTVEETYEYYPSGVTKKLTEVNTGVEPAETTIYDYAENGFLSKKTNNNGRYEVYREAPGYALGYNRIDYYLSNGTIYETANFDQDGVETGRYGYDEG